MSETTNSPDVAVESDQVFPVLRENILADGLPLVADLERSHGSQLVDALEGKQYLDCYSCFASLPIGHNHPKMADPGFLQTLTRAALALRSARPRRRGLGFRFDLSARLFSSGFRRGGRGPQDTLDGTHDGLSGHALAEPLLHRAPERPDCC